MAGSEGFRRTPSCRGDAETDATRRPVHVAITYAEDGTIRLFRDGRPYGSPYKSSGPVTFAAGETRSRLRAAARAGRRQQDAGRHDRAGPGL